MPDTDRTYKTDQDVISFKSFKRMVIQGLFDITPSQEDVLRRFFTVLEDEIKTFYEDGSKRVNFRVPMKMHNGNFWVQFHSESAEDTGALSLTDRYYALEIGVRGAVTLECRQWDQAKTELFYISL